MDLDRHVLAAAERAADAGEVDTDLLRGEREAGRDLVAVDVDPLRGDVDVDASLAVGDGEARLGAEERLVLRAHLVDAADRDVALDVGVSVPDHHRANDVGARVLAEAVAGSGAVGMERLLLGRQLGVRDGRQLLVGDLDRGGGAAGLLGALGGDDRHRLAVVAHAVDGEHRLVGDLEAVRLRARDVGVGQDGVDAGRGEGGGDVDREDARVRVRAAQRVAPEHARRLEVARERELALRLRHGVGAEDALADAPVLEAARGGDRLVRSWRTFATHGYGFPRYDEIGWWYGVAPKRHALSAAVFTASTIFW